MTPNPITLAGLDHIVLRIRDKAAMIAFAALLRHLAGECSPLDGDIHRNLPLV